MFFFPCPSGLFLRVYLHRGHNSPYADRDTVHRPSNGWFWPQSLQRLHGAVLGWWYDACLNVFPGHSGCAITCLTHACAVQVRCLWSSGSGSDSQGWSPREPSHFRLPSTKQEESHSATGRWGTPRHCAHFLFNLVAACVCDPSSFL